MDETRQARAMSMTIHSSIKARILEAQIKASKSINTPAIMLKGLDKQFEKKEDGGLYLAERIWETADKIVQIKEGLKTARDRQKSYTNNQRKPLKFSVGDKVLLKVPPRKGVVRFGKRSKLSPRYVGPFEIIERVGPVAYRLCLLQELVGVHYTFHVSNMKKCLAEIDLHIPLEEVKIEDKLHYVEEPIKIMDREVKKPKRN
nr:putative reverse transcriptase domain-containing protein [Tanacetum cinerariifolium]